jgi:hypothetical protein
MRAALFAILVALLVGAACAHTPECKQRIDNCLRRCPPPPESTVRNMDSEIHQGQLVDGMNSCEHRCYDMCSATPDSRPGPIAPAESPTSPP